MNRRDYGFGLSAGLLIGIFFLPVLNVTEPALYAKYYFYVIPFFLIGTFVGLLVAKTISNKISIVWSIAKFGVIGVLNTLIDWGVLGFLILYFAVDPKEEFISLGVLSLTFYVLYKSASFVIANINSYFWNKYWTFSGNINKKTSQEFIQFFVVSVIGFFINVGIAVYIFSNIQPVFGLNFDQWGIVGAAFGSITGLIWNFIGYKFFVFNHPLTFSKNSAIMSKE